VPLNEWSFLHLPDALERLVVQLENEPSLVEPNQLRQRLEALDRLDSHLTCNYQGASGAESIQPELYPRARAICVRLEAANRELYEIIRSEIKSGSRADSLLRWVSLSSTIDDESNPANGMGYDYLDELIAGVLQFEEPNGVYSPRDSEMVFYQPTPARHIFSLIELTALTPTDVLVDLGSGMGHVPLLASICSDSHCVGIELEATYVERAQQCAKGLNLNRVSFIQEDARLADLSIGTIFYLYTPFTGSILKTVLGRLKREAASRRIRICSYGPCTSVIAGEPWLHAASASQAHRIALFTSRD
jgi:hypothetical protein